MSEEKETTEPTEPTEPTDTEDEIKYATLQGWTDKETYKGKHWKSAKEFIEEGNKHATILKERNKKLSDQVSELQSTMGDLVKDQKTQKAKAVKRAIDELKVQKAEAINESDGEKVNKIDDEIDRIKEEAQPKVETNADFDSWITDNAWYHTEPELKGEADMYAKAYIDAGSFKTIQEVYAAVSRKIKRDFPDHFENPNKKEPATVSQGAHSGNASSNGKTYADLPSEAKSACDRFVKTIPKFTKEKYLANYEWD